MEEWCTREVVGRGLKTSLPDGNYSLYIKFMVSIDGYL